MQAESVHLQAGGRPLTDDVEEQPSCGGAARSKEPVIGWRHSEFDRLVHVAQHHQVSPRNSFRDLPTLPAGAGATLDPRGGVKPAGL